MGSGCLLPGHSSSPYLSCISEQFQAAVTLPGSAHCRQRVGDGCWSHCGRELLSLQQTQLCGVFCDMHKQERVYMGLIFRSQECFVSCPSPPPPQVLNNLGFKNNSWVLCLFIWSPQDTVASFPPSATRAQNILSFSEFFLRRWYSLCII